MLGPPTWLNRDWLEPNDRAGLDLFKKYRANAPTGIVPAGGSTVQGVYCMTADGEYLSGYFAWAFKDRAKSVIERGWRQFQTMARDRGWNPQPVPKNRLVQTLGRQIEHGGMKLEAAIRDLPRGEVVHPGRNEFERCSHNVKWIDLTAQQARAFVTESKTPRPVVRSAWQELASRALKDCARGQCSDWKPEHLRHGELLTQLIQRDDGHLTLRITGEIRFESDERSFGPKLFGRAVYDQRTEAFRSFQLVAVGQRTGRAGANGRQHDMGPAPLGVAFTAVDR